MISICFKKQYLVRAFPQISVDKRISTKKEFQKYNDLGNSQ